MPSSEKRYIKARDLTAGDMIDMEGNPYLTAGCSDYPDCDACASNETVSECEICTVDSAGPVTIVPGAYVAPGDYILAYFENLQGPILFPLDSDLDFQGHKFDKGEYGWEPGDDPKEMDSPPSNFPWPVSDDCDCGVGYSNNGHLPGCSALRD